MFTSRSSSRSNRRPVWMCALALLTVGLLAPSSAKAAHCGQYVQSQARFESELASLLSGDLAADRSILPGMPLPPVAPCKGSFCSTPPALPAAPVTPVTAPSLEGLCPIGRGAVPTVDSCHLPAKDDKIQPVLGGLSIFHPPRQVRAAA